MGGADSGSRSGSDRFDRRCVPPDTLELRIFSAGQARQTERDSKWRLSTEATELSRPKTLVVAFSPQFRREREVRSSGLRSPGSDPTRSLSASRTTRSKNSEKRTSTATARGGLAAVAFGGACGPIATPVERLEQDTAMETPGLRLGGHGLSRRGDAPPHGPGSRLRALPLCRCAA